MSQSKPADRLKTDAQIAPIATGAGRRVGWLPLCILPLATILVRDQLPAWLFMWTLAFTIFLGLKWQTWWSEHSHIPRSGARSLAYLLLWPGMDAEAFLDSNRHPKSTPTPREWLGASAKTLFGIALLWMVARRVPAGEPLFRGWIGLLGSVLVLHFGSFELIALFWQSRGIDAQPIMASPISSSTLSEFWGKRWNLGFRQLAHQLIFRPLHKRIGVVTAGLLVFLASGLLHDLVISLPARGGYGLPTLYFILQGLGVVLERSRGGRALGLQHGVRARIFAFLVTAAPVFWLFHPPFILRVILPFMRAIRAL